MGLSERCGRVMQNSRAVNILAGRLIILLLNFIAFLLEIIRFFFVLDFCQVVERYFLRVEVRQTAPGRKVTHDSQLDRRKKKLIF